MFQLHIEGTECNHTLSADRLSASSDHGWPMLVASVSGNAGQVRAFGAALNANNMKLSMRVRNLPEGSNAWFGCMAKDGYGYKVSYHRLAYHDWQAVAFSQRPGMIVSATIDGLWSELTSPRFTTPLLYHWMPWIAEKLRTRGKLMEVTSLGCQPALLNCTSEVLDAIVSEGLRLGKLKIARAE